MKKNNKFRAMWLGTCAFFLLSPVALAQPAEFSMEISPRNGTMKDQFVLTVRTEVPGIAGASRYWDPDTREFSVLDRQRRITNASRIDGKRGQVLMSVEIRRYVLQPKRVGSLYIGPARVRVGDSEYQTKSVVVRVRSVGRQGAQTTFDPSAGTAVEVPGFRGPPAGWAKKRRFLHVVSDKKEAFVGEQVTVTWLLYVRQEILSFQPRPPALANLWNEVVFEPKSRLDYSEAMVGSTPFLVTVVSQRALFAADSGLVKVQPFAASLSDARTPLGKTDQVRSPVLELLIKPFPEPVPDSFDAGYVGKFEIEAVVDRRRVEASGALTLTLAVRGTGALRRTTPPVLSFDGFEFQSPRDYEEKISVQGKLVEGERIYRYWTTPTKGGKRTIPAIELWYFDPVHGRFDTARTKPIAVEVFGDPTAEVAQVVVSSQENVLDRDIKLIRDRTPLSSRVLPYFFQSVWFWVLAFFPPFVFVVVMLVDRIRERLKRETPRARIRRARGRTRQRLRVAEIHLRGNRPPRFFGELTRVIQENLEERVGRPLQSLTRSEIQDLLRRRGFDRSSVAQIDVCLEKFDFARFAPSATGQEEMREALEETQALLRRIEKQYLHGQEASV